jgi:hypothetical protein
MKHSRPKGLLVVVAWKEVCVGGNVDSPADDVWRKKNAHNRECPNRRREHSGVMVVVKERK